MIQLLCLGILLFPPPQSEVSAEDVEQHVKEEMTVTAERTPLRLKDSPGSVTVIDDREIQEQTAQDTTDLVRFEPGVYVERDLERLGTNGFNIRGIGGNRVRTRIDGVATADQFAFGPLAVNQFLVDVDLIKRVEIVKSAGSSLYGSDALGGTVSFETLDPGDLLSPQNAIFAGHLKTGYSSDNEGAQIGFTTAMRLSNWDLLAHGTFRSDSERDNMGTNDAEDLTRTRPNPLDGETRQVLLKAVRQLSENNRFRINLEVYDAEVDASLYSAQGTFVNFGVSTRVSDATATDHQKRYRFSVDQVWSPSMAFFDTLEWRAWLQNAETSQETHERRLTAAGPAPVEAVRNGSMEFEQRIAGAELVLRRSFSGRGEHELVYGISLEENRFEQIRHRSDLDPVSGADVYHGTLVFPSRYFPPSTVSESGAFVLLQSRWWEDRLTVIPALRYDHYRLSPDENDTVFLEATGSASTPVSLDDGALSPKIGVNLKITDHWSVAGQYAAGFRVPPYNSVNSGFTNLSGGYLTLPNGDLDPEESDNVDLSLKGEFDRGWFRLTRFDNRYDQFIDDTAFAGISPQGLFMFQPQNIDKVDIEGWEFSGELEMNRLFSLRAVYADIEGTNRVDDTPLASVPPRQGTLTLRMQMPSARFGGTLSVTDTAKVAEVPKTPQFTPESHTLWDLTGYCRLWQGLELNLAVFNLSDETYHSWSESRGLSADSQVIDRYTSPGLTWRAHMNYRW